ncbi:MAG TPA: AMP-binding protein [Spirochaetales bacterium]|nr:AMP-binding protein [Spirochaetales bacterium]HRY55725.1 AMP-binding protein [Spirochaetia bacterium]HRZ65972.1 AMP-binding protein [Spirochaetia bacterium]
MNPSPESAWIGNYSYFRARTSPGKVALTDLDDGRSFTYRQLDERSNRLASFLRDEWGIGRGDRFAFLSRNRVELVDALFAAGKLGAILVPYNVRLSVDELAALVADEGPRALFYEECFEQTVAQLRGKANIERYLRLGERRGSPADEYAAVESRPRAEPVSCPGLSEDDIFMLIHTGGTTGIPKAAMLSHRCVLFNALSEIVTWRLTDADSSHILLPLFHTGGWNLLTIPLLVAGGRVILNRQFDPKQSIEVIQRERTTTVFGAATIFRMIQERPEFEKADFSSVRWMMAGAAPTPIQVMEAYWKREIPFALGYGMTEAGPNNLSAPADQMSFGQMREKFASVGKPFFFAQMRIVDDEGRDVPAGQNGELIWSGPQIFSGYWNKPEATRETLREGWVYTGDIAAQDADGFVYIVGRKKNMYISGGENVFPPEIEKVLYEIPEIHEVCVIGVPDEKWGEVGKAVVALKPGASIDKARILAALQAKLAKYKVPKYLAFVKAVPKNSVGKIVSSEAQKLYGKPVDEDLR